VPLQVNRLWSFADLPSPISGRGLRSIRSRDLSLYSEIYSWYGNILPLATRLGTS